MLTRSWQTHTAAAYVEVGVQLNARRQKDWFMLIENSLAKAVTQLFTNAKSIKGLNPTWKQVGRGTENWANWNFPEKKSKWKGTIFLGIL